MCRRRARTHLVIMNGRLVPRIKGQGTLPARRDRRDLVGRQQPRTRAYASHTLGLTNAAQASLWP